MGVPYSAAVNGYGTGTAAVGAYSDFWTTTDTPTIDPYWTAPTGATPATACGFTSCSLYMPSASGSCLLSSTAGSLPAIPPAQEIKAPTIALTPASTSGAPVTYATWETYMSGQAVPTLVNLSMLATQPWTIYASNSNPLGYSHTVCYACSFGYNVMSPTVGKVTAKITIKGYHC